MRQANPRARNGALLRIALGCMLASSAGGCGSEETTDAPAAIGAARRAPSIDVDPCTLLTRAEVQDALGADVLEPRPPELPGVDVEQMPVRMCEFGAAAGGLRSLIVSVAKRPTTVEQFEQKLAAVGKLGAELETKMMLQPVSGVGDAAAWNRATGLSFVRNGVEVDVMDGLTERPGESPPEGVLRLARLIAGRL